MNTCKSRAARAVCVLAVAGLTGMGLSSVSAGAQAAPPPGVTAKTVTIGFLYDGSGAAASTFQNAAKAFQARIDRANADGGVNGRKIKTVVIDDMTSGANLTGAQDLVKNHKVFMVVNDSGVGFLSYRYLLGAGVPMIGGGFDGAYYSQQGNENVIPALGALVLPSGLAYNTPATVAKAMGGTKMAAIAVNTPGAAESTDLFQKYGPASVGMKPVYTNVSLDLGTTDVGPPVLGVKNAGADAVLASMTASTVVAIMQTLKQNGVDTKATIGTTGYGQALLDSPAADALGPNDVFGSVQAPVELKTKATKQLQSDLKKYSGLTGVPDFGVYTGYLTADLTVLGLQLAGKQLTRDGFISAIRKHGKYDGAGLFCAPVDLSLAAFGKFPEKQCAWYLNVKDGKFVVVNNGKPFIGKLIGDRDALAANAVANAAVTTTAPPTSAP